LGEAIRGFKDAFKDGEAKSPSPETKALPTDTNDENKKRE
jgi:hypothetical protein